MLRLPVGDFTAGTAVGATVGALVGATVGAADDAATDDAEDDAELDGADVGATVGALVAVGWGGAVGTGVGVGDAHPARNAVNSIMSTIARPSPCLLFLIFQFFLFDWRTRSLRVVNDWRLAMTI
jgi:hypothetical protein